MSGRYLNTYERPRPGDMAQHRSGLDGRRVTKVTEDGQGVWLFILTGTHGPFPAENYTFYRPEERES